MRRLEIRSLTSKNMKLMDQLKKLSRDVDVTMERAKAKADLRQKSDYAAVPSEEKLIAKLASAGKMIKRYEAEVKDLRKMVELQTGYERVVELEGRSEELLKLQEEKQRRVQELRKRVKIDGKTIEKSSQRIEEGIPQTLEKGVLQQINGAREVAAALEQRLKQLLQIVSKPDQDSAGLEKQIQKEELELETIKREAAQIGNAKDKMAAENQRILKNTTVDAEKIKAEIEETKELLESEGRKTREELGEVLGQRDDLKARLDDLGKVAKRQYGEVEKQDKRAHDTGADADRESGEAREEEGRVAARVDGSGQETGGRGQQARAHAAICSFRSRSQSIRNILCNRAFPRCRCSGRTTRAATPRTPDPQTSARFTAGAFLRRRLPTTCKR